MTQNPVVFIHGLWLHADSWQPWMQFFSEQGYETHNPPWPGDSATPEASRQNPKPIARRGVKEVADHYAKFISALSAPPILIGHSFGGLLVQNLLGRGIAAAAVAIDPAPFRGVWQLPISALRSAFPVLANPFNLRKAVMLSPKQFRYGFTNAVSDNEAKELYEKWAIPAPGLPLFQAATATFNPFSETRVNTKNPARGPLLITAGESDNTAPPVLSKSAVRQYRKSPATTDFKSFANRGHSITIDHGWREVAEYSLEWLKKNGL